MIFKAFAAVAINFSVFILAGGVIIGCQSSRNARSNYVYFNDGADTISIRREEVKIYPGDQLSISVYSKTQNQEQAAIFNVPANSNSGTQGYEVTSEGSIELPLLGAITAAGLTKEQLEASLAEKLSDFVKDAVVVVRFSEFNISVLGEVKSPGIQKFTSDRVTIIDALSSAGDLTDNGKRETIRVIREEGGKRISYFADLRNKELFLSPVFLLRPNDIVYVEPNENKLKNLSVDPLSQRRTGLIFSVVSIVVGIGALAVTIFR